MKFYTSIFLLLLFLCCGSMAFSQTTTPIKLSCPATNTAQGPLCLLVFKKKTLYTMDNRLVDSIVNPKTVKSMKVEKDVAKAGAIYGTRAANGVVIIEIERKYARKEYNRLKSYLNKF